MERKIKILISALFCLSVLSGLAEEPESRDLVVANISDVTVADEAKVQIAVRYQSSLGVSARSFDDADLWVTNSQGFHASVAFVEVGTLVPLPGPNGDVPEVLFHFVLYEMAAPKGGWTAEHNGEYAVILAGNEVLRNDGSFFEMALAGSFKVEIGEVKQAVPALAGEVSVEMFPTPGAPGGDIHELAIATFTVTYPYPVEVNWGEVTRTANGNFCVEVEGCQLDGIVPQVLITYTHRVEVGMFEPGSYEAALKSAGEILGRDEFSVHGGDGNGDLMRGVPSEVEIDIVRLPTRGLYPTFAAHIRMTFGQYVDHIDWGGVIRRGDLIESEMTAWIDTRTQLVAPMVIEHEIGLGMFFPGDYQYQLSSLKEVIGRALISVPGPQGDFLPPQVTIRGASVTEAGDEPLEFSVEFFDDGELVFDGIEAQVLSVMNRQGEMVELERTSLSFTADMSVGAIATYRMNPPDGSWDAQDHGRYRILLSEPELVSDLFGNSLVDPFIGYLSVEIEPDDPEPTHNTELVLRNDELIGRWIASVRLFVPEDLAVRDDWSVDWGEVRPRGPSFYLHPRFVRAGSNEEVGLIPPSDTAGAGMWVEHDYDLGPISGGRWLVCLNSNLGHFAKERLIEGDPDRPIDPEEPFDFWSQWVDREVGLEDHRRFWEYCVGTDPADPADDHEGDPRPEMIDGEDGKKHLALRCRIATEAVDARLRFEGSADMNTWVELGPDEIEEVERVVRGDGIEEFVVCLIDDIKIAEIRYLRVVAERW
ncbi:MAG: hypothetical protein ABF382_06760 [Akkermansiaceae bacterium]